MTEKYDIILVSGDAYVDHPSFGSAVIKRTLEGAGYTVGVISQPDWTSKKDFERLGAPKLFFAVTSGNMDSMVANYTPMKRKREFDAYSPDGIAGKRPDRAIIVYCNRIREAFPGSKMVIGGIEASLRRFTHYDYWDNKLRGSLLFDSRADILVYGMGEYACIEIADRIKEEKDLDGIKNTCIILKEIPADFTEMPSHENVMESKDRFNEAFKCMWEHEKVVQKKGNRYLVQYPQKILSTEELDYVYSLPFTRTHDYKERIPALDPVKFSVVTHRGCFGQCSFCALFFHQGKVIQSRSEESIIKEIKTLTRHKDWNGMVDDIGGPSANMYGMSCKKENIRCRKGCLNPICINMTKSHSRIISLLKKVRAIPKVKRAFIRSGIRYDLALEDIDYIKEIAKYHVSGSLKVAPEHASDKVLKLMNKPEIKNYLRFMEIFKKESKACGKGQGVIPYFMAGHPGSTKDEMKKLTEFVKVYGEFDQGQLFTPTPMTLSTAMYYTGKHPLTGEEIYVPYTYNEKKLQKALLHPSKEENKERLQKEGF